MVTAPERFVVERDFRRPPFLKNPMSWLVMLSLRITWSSLAIVNITVPTPGTSADLETGVCDDTGGGGETRSRGAPLRAASWRC